MIEPTSNSFQGNILVVDDTPANLRLLTDILTKNKYQVRPVPNGKLALSAAQGMPPDLILLDIMMPEINGYQVCEKLKALPETRDIPVIFISAIDEVVDKVKAFAVGGIDYITKPFQVEEVLARVETHLRIRSLQQNLQRKNEDLAATIQQLQDAQEQLIQSEKMAALGQLIAGIAHELNTPLGIIQSSIENIAAFFQQNLEILPDFFQQLTAEERQYFSDLLSKSLDENQILTSREKRRHKQQAIAILEAENIEHYEAIADTLIDMEIYQKIELFLDFFRETNSKNILNKAYQFSSLNKSTKLIKTATERASKIVFALRTYARQNTNEFKSLTDINQGIDTALTLYYNYLKQGIEVIKQYSELPKILGYPDELNQVWTNLIQNALQAMDYQGNLVVETRQENDKILISFIDSGKGIDREIMPKLFQPFFTTKPPGEGSGLGLNIVKKIIDKHQGEISVESIPGKTNFTVSLPIVS